MESRFVVSKSPEYIASVAKAVGIDETSQKLLTQIDPDLALIVARAKEMYDADHGSDLKYTFQVEQGFRSLGQQKNIPAKNTMADGVHKKSYHQFGEAIDFRIWERDPKTSQFVRQTDAREGNKNNLYKDDREEDHADYKTIAWYMYKASEDLRDKGVIEAAIVCGADGSVQVNGYNDWGHVQIKRAEWRYKTETAAEQHAHEGQSENTARNVEASARARARSKSPPTTKS